MEIKEIVGKLKKFSPESIFLYGSRARTDFLDRSDFEIGVIFKEENYVHRSELKKAIKEKGISVYPFRFNEIKNGIFDTPFSKKIYLKELIKSAKTIFGENIIETLKEPNIETIDVIREIGFSVGRAFDSMLCSRVRDKINANMFFYKSNLFGTRCLIISELKKFPIEFNEIVKLSKELNIEKQYKDLIEKAFESRKSGLYEENDLFKNITYLNKIVEMKIIQTFKEEGNNVLL